MVTAKESQSCQQLSARSLSDLNQMALLQLEQNCSSHRFIPSALTANHALPGQPDSHLLGFNTGQPIADAGIISYSSGNPCLKNSQHGLGVLDKPIDASCGHGKRFLIFDRSDNHTRLFVRSFSCENNIISSKVHATASGLCQKVAEANWDENSLDDGGEMVEDTEDINALLHSDSDDEYDDDSNDGEDYELTSMRHTLLGIEDCGNKDKLHERAMEEVVSSDSSPKRQKLLDGSCKKSSLGGSVKPAPPCNYKYDVVSHGTDLSKNDNMVKIHEAVKILGSIIPGLNSKDPLSIIERAIVYLEAMKKEAKSFGYNTTS